MRFNEIANADDQLALWLLISDNVWSAVMAQAKEQERQQAALRAKAAATPKPKPKMIKPQKSAPKKPPAPKPPPPKSPVPQLARMVSTSRPPPLPTSQPVLRPTHASSFSQADAYGLQPKTMGPGQASMPR
jgi:outer membrane biosynthesis protein TonB